MNKVKEFFKKKRAILYAALALLLVAAISAGFGISAKYRKDISIPGKLIIDAGLASDIYIKEPLAERKTDGSYLLKTEGEPVDSNSFIVMPGVELPRDPFVKIDGKTEIPAYLYAEIVKSGNIEFTVDGSKWTKLEGKTGKNGGDIYAYYEVLTNLNSNDRIYILSEKKVTVAEGEAELDFYPYMLKQTDGSTPASAFNKDYVGKGTTGTYTPAKQNAAEVVHENDGTVDVKPGNEDYPVYVRATVVVNWKMADGVVYAKKVVEGVDYRFNTDGKWFCCDSDGFYYYTDPVAEGETASDLVKLFSAIGEAPEGCTLSVTVVTQTIQAAGGAVTTEWGCTVNDDGTISKN